jgi:BRCA1-associated protein
VKGPSANICCVNLVQIKDFKFSIRVQKSIEKNGGGLKGGTLVPLPMASDSGGKGKRSSRTTKRKN